MKIVLAGGGSGGHFNPLIAVTQEINELVKLKKLVPVKLYYLAPVPYDERLLFESNIQFIKVAAGKWRRYFSWRNFFDLAKTIIGVAQAFWRVYRLYPDVVFSKGGYASFPVLVATRWLRIPVVIHESDSRPGRANLWAGRFAARIAVSYPEAAASFPTGKTAVTGNPLRRELLYPISHGAYEFLGLVSGRPVIFITGGSQGAAAINDVILDILPQLLERYQIIHQVGAKNLDEVKKRVSVIISSGSALQYYHPYDYLNETALRMVAGIAKLVVSRAGSTIFEIAQWGIPSIIIPLPESISHDQRLNAFTYARAGGAVVIEQKNLTGSVFLSEINRLLGDELLLAAMRQGALSFARPAAGRLIAEAILDLALTHAD